MKKIGSYFIKTPGRKPQYDIDKIKTMILDKIEDRAIAEKIGCHISRIREIRRDMGICKGKIGVSHARINYSKVKELYSKGFNDYEIAAELECSRTSVANWRIKNGYPSVNKVKKCVRNNNEAI